MEGVVDGTVASRFAMPFGQTQLDIFVVALQRHVHDGGHATPCSGNRASFKRVYCGCATERQLHVSVHVDATGHDVFTLGVNHLVGGYTHGIGLTAGIQRHDDLAVNQDVLFMATSRAYDRAIFNQRAGHVVLLWLTANEFWIGIRTAIAVERPAVTHHFDFVHV